MTPSVIWFSEPAGSGASVPCPSPPRPSIPGSRDISAFRRPISPSSDFCVLRLFPPPSSWICALLFPSPPSSTFSILRLSASKSLGILVSLLPTSFASVSFLFVSFCILLHGAFIFRSLAVPYPSSVRSPPWPTAYFTFAFSKAVSMALIRDWDV